MTSAIVAIENEDFFDYRGFAEMPRAGEKVIVDGDQFRVYDVEHRSATATETSSTVIRVRRIGATTENDSRLRKVAKDAADQ